MPLMTNAEAFRYDFGISATELWTMTQGQLEDWLNEKCDRERPADMVVRCKDCKWWKTNYSWDGKEHKVCVIQPYEPVRKTDDYCSYGERKFDVDS